MKVLELRNRIKRRKPRFLRQDAHKKNKLENNWRRPKGIQSKMRLNFRGYRRKPSPGYGSPREAKGLTQDGFKIILVNNLNDLSLIKDNNVALISGNVGNKKRLIILDKIKKDNLKILGIKNVDDEIKRISDSFLERKKKAKKKEDKLKEEKKKVEEKEAKDKVEEEKKKEVKKEEKVEDKVKEQKKKEDIEKKKVLEKKN